MEKHSNEEVADALDFMVTEHHRFCEMNDEIAALNASIEDQDTEIDALKDKMREKDSKIEDLEGELDGLRNFVEDISDRCNQAI